MGYSRPSELPHDVMRIDTSEVTSPAIVRVLNSMIAALVRLKNRAGDAARRRLLDVFDARRLAVL